MKRWEGTEDVKLLLSSEKSQLSMKGNRIHVAFRMFSQIRNAFLVQKSSIRGWRLLLRAHLEKPSTEAAWKQRFLFTMADLFVDVTLRNITHRVWEWWCHSPHPPSRWPAAVSGTLNNGILIRRTKFQVRFSKRPSAGGRFLFLAVAAAAAAANPAVATQSSYNLGYCRPNKHHMLDAAVHFLPPRFYSRRRFYRMRLERWYKTWANERLQF